LLRGCFDESGIHRESTVTSVAGLVATEQEWSVVEEKWSEVLADLGIAYFHMVECENAEGEFSTLAEWKRRYAITKFSDIIRDCHLIPIWSSVDQIHWNTMDGNAAKYFKRYYKKPLYLAFEY
jgi:hypothetical protein